MTLSDKKRTELYDVVHNEIYDARIKIWSMRENKQLSIAEIDDILYKLCISAPQKAIELFTEKQKQ
jgi:hypothetical protein